MCKCQLCVHVVREETGGWMTPQATPVICLKMLMCKKLHGLEIPSPFIK